MDSYWVCLLAREIVTFYLFVCLFFWIGNINIKPEWYNSETFHSVTGSYHDILLTVTIRHDSVCPIFTACWNFFEHIFLEAMHNLKALVD